ncbi:hypothetical protein GXP70_12420 [Paenibacillus lycopersici]|uniref:Uncharacterized protein n=1 Tax=Paenibacillus lycopersici TaxID=2704462 RepID=A0A6C0G5Y7_9BACL|nr:hypothetical protein [Paenibacillus lycopersici]QHT60665.1 hypothetical protein GXP70_12420 [Paenibacillus lycopersici]
MSIFGDETITPLESPDDSGQDDAAAAGQTGSDDPEFDDQDDNDADFDDEGDDEQPEDGDDEPPQSGQGDGLILGKFKTQDDLAKAYTNLQREFTKQRQGGGQGGQQQAPTQQQPAGQHQDPNAIFWDSFKSDPFGTMLQMIRFTTQGEIAPILEQRNNETLGRNFEAVAKAYPAARTEEGMKQVWEKVSEIANELGNPQLMQQPTERILRMAAQEAFGSSTSKAYEQGKRAGREDAANTRRNKQAANMPKGNKQQKPTDLSPAEQMKANILAAGKGGGLFG